MSDAAAGDPTSPQSSPGEAAVPEGLVSAVVELVHTGPVMLGAYTLAELTAVDAIVDFLEARPSDEVLAEAVRSLSARELLVAEGVLRDVGIVAPENDGRPIVPRASTRRAAAEATPAPEGPPFVRAG